MFYQALYVFPVSDGGDLFPGSSATNLLPLMLGVFLLRSEACSTEVVALIPDFGQVFVKGQRPFWPKIFALMPDFGQVFVKGEGLFGYRGRFKLPLPMAGALKGPVVFVYRILQHQSWPLSVLGFCGVLLGNYLFILVEDFYIEPASLKTSPPLGVPL